VHVKGLLQKLARGPLLAQLHHFGYKARVIIGSHVIINRKSPAFIAKLKAMIA